MILDNIDYMESYLPLYPQFAAIFPFLKAVQQEFPASGIYELDGRRIYAVVQEYSTCPASTLPWEFHQKYLDVQYIREGEEDICWISREALQECSNYNEENDSVTSSALCPCSVIRVSAGQFVIFAPQDAHKPKCMHLASGQVKKVIFKIAL